VEVTEALSQRHEMREQHGAAKPEVLILGPAFKHRFEAVLFLAQRPDKIPGQRVDQCPRLRLAQESFDDIGVTGVEEGLRLDELHRGRDAPFVDGGRILGWPLASRSLSWTAPRGFARVR